MCASQISAAPTAQTAFDKSVAKLRAATGVSASFSITQSGRTFNGTLKSKGSKFAIVTPGNGAWYDGKILTTYTADSGEAVQVTPTAEELRETNPLLYLSSASDYTVKETQSGNGVKNFSLTPKKRGTQVKQISVAIGAASLLPQSIVMTLTNGQKISVKLSNVSLKSTHADSEFKFPQKRYPGAKIVKL